MFPSSATTLTACTLQKDGDAVSLSLGKQGAPGCLEGCGLFLKSCVIPKELFATCLEVRGEVVLGIAVSRYISFTLPQEVTPDSEKDINRLSTFPFPPCIGSILRRQREDRCMPYKR